MIASEMREYFDILQDKTGSPWFTDAEKDEFLYSVIYGYINEFIGDGDTPPTLEKNKGATAAISTLLEKSTEITVPSTGRLTNTLINAEITGDAIMVVSMKNDSDLPIRFVRHNDLDTFRQNTYKAPSATQIYYSIIADGYQLTPESAHLVRATVLVEPAAITSLPIYKHYEQVAKAMAKTGFVTEAEALVIMGTQEGK